MPKIDVLNKSKKVVGEVSLSDECFGADLNVPVMHQVVMAQMAGRRRGTQSTKTRAEVRGGGKKPWKQKGTGRARSGSSRSPIWKGGGASHGPKPRDYEQAVTKKVRKIALLSALSSIFAEGRLKVVDSLEMKELKTKLAIKLLKGFGAVFPVLVVHGADCETFARSARNVPDVKTLPVEGVNVYDLLNCNTMICTKSAIEGIEKRLQK
jgi:large subunit ribosomal protein L4